MKSLLSSWKTQVNPTGMKQLPHQYRENCGNERRRVTEHRVQAMYRCYAPRLKHVKTVLQNVAHHSYKTRYYPCHGRIEDACHGNLPVLGRLLHSPIADPPKRLRQSCRVRLVVMRPHLPPLGIDSPNKWILENKKHV